MIIPKKSPLDPSEYQTIELDNGLYALLIYDSNLVKSSVAMCVSVGEIESTIPGLAHLIEHVICESPNDKYPKHAYADFILDNRGFFNASTEMDNTKYYFEIGCQYFEKAYDIFSHLFINPIFDKEIIDAEIQAVESEYKLKLNNDAFVIESIIKDTINQKQPNSKFKSGNAKTLKVPQVYKHIEQMIHKYYCPQNMKLVVYSNLPLDKQKQMVTTTFSKIKRKGIKPKDSKEPYIISPQYITYKSQRKTGYVDLIWYIETPFDSNLNPDLDSNASIMGFIRYIIESDRVDSIGNYLRLHSLIFANIRVIMHSFRDGVTQFVIDIIINQNKTWENSENNHQLTTSACIKFILNYIEHIKNLFIRNDESVIRLYNEYITIRKQSYTYDPPNTSLREIKKIAKKMAIHNIPYEYIYFYSDGLGNYNEKVQKLIVNTLSKLTSDKLNVYYKSANGYFDKQEKYSQFQYTTQPLDVIMQLNPSVPPIKGIPKLNRYVPRRINYVRNKNPTDEITCISPELNVWLYGSQHHKHSTYRSKVEIIIQCEDVLLNEWFYLALLIYTKYNVVMNSYDVREMNEAGHTIDINSHYDVISFWISSYPDQIRKITKQIIQKFTQSLLDDFDMTSFNIAITSVKMELKYTLYDNVSHTRLLDIASDYIIRAPDNRTLLEILENTNADTIIQLIKHVFTKRFQLTCFVTGNVNEKIGNYVIDCVSGITTRNEILPPINLRYLSSGKHKIKKFCSNAVSDKNHAIYVPFQIRSLQYNTKKFMRILCMSIILQKIIQPKFYTQLRTVENIGYVAFMNYSVWANQNTTTIYIYMLLVSPNYNSEHMSDRIHRFINTIPNEIDKITQNQWNNYKDEVIKSIQTNTIDYVSNTTLIRNQITQFAKYRFQFIRVIRSLTINDFKEFIHRYLINPSTRSYWEFRLIPFPYDSTS